MEVKKPEDQKVDVSFESHPPIEDDLDGIATLLRQSLLQFADCSSLAKYLIQLKDVTQVIALEAPDEENTSEDDEPDNEIYGVSSVIELPVKSKPNDDTSQIEPRRQLLKFLKDKCPEFKKTLHELDSETNSIKIGMIVNERYINLPPQLALPTLKVLTRNLDESHYTHLVFIAKILLRSRSSETKLASKKSKSGQSSAQDTEPIVFVNPEEEIVCEGSEYHTDIDVSCYCDENATWSFSSDIKYTPHRRIMLVDYKNWPTIIKNLEKELKQ